jgi:hypothetical protein
MLSEHNVNMKCGDKEIKYQFSIEQFVAQYQSQSKSKKPYDPDKMIESIVYNRNFMTPFSILRDVYFTEGPQMKKVKKGFISNKEIPDYCRNFLLFKDEELQDITPTSGDLPFAFHKENLLQTGRVYSTGRRLIFDSHYTTSDFSSIQFWGPIDMLDCLRSLSKSHFTLAARHYDEKWMRIQTIQFNATGFETETRKGLVHDRLFILGIGGFNLPGTGKSRSDFYFALKGPDETRALIELDPWSLPGDFPTIEEEVKKLKETTFSDILAMRQYATNAKLLQAANVFSGSKGPASLVYIG